jgi:hypothetical protein
MKVRSIHSQQSWYQLAILAVPTKKASKSFCVQTPNHQRFALPSSLLFGRIPTSMNKMSFDLFCVGIVPCKDVWKRSVESGV